MCEYTKNYYIYTSCQDPGAHFFSTSVDGKRDYRCKGGPHERYIVVADYCPLCCHSWCWPRKKFATIIAARWEDTFFLTAIVMEMADGQHITTPTLHHYTSINTCTYQLPFQCISISMGILERAGVKKESQLDHYFRDAGESRHSIP